MEASGHLGQRVSPGGSAGEAQASGGLAGLLLLLQVMRPHLLADAGLQQAGGGYGAVPQQPVQADLHWKHHSLGTGGAGGRLRVSRGRTGDRWGEC